MNALLKIEEAFLFIASLLIYPYLNISWWWFAGCILLPDIGMVGYLIGNKAGAYTYNLIHHKGVAVVVAFCGFCFSSQWLLFAGLILFAHSSMDRMLGYGLKFEKGFKFTHLKEL